MQLPRGMPWVGGLIIVAVCLVALASGLAGCGSSGRTLGPTNQGTVSGSTTVPRSDADTKLAASAVLSNADLNPDWSVQASADDRIVPEEARCFMPSEGQPTGSADGRFYVAGGPVYIVAGGVFPRGSHVVTSSVRVYETESAAQAALSDVGEGLQDIQTSAHCVYDADTITKGPALSRVRGGVFPASTFPFGDDVRAALFRAEFAKDKKSTVEVLPVFIRSGRVLGFVLFSELASPPVSYPLSDTFVRDTVQKFSDRLAQSG